MNKLIENAQKLVFKLMESDKSGHGSDHILRVYNLAIKFAEAEGADKTIVSLAALLHDVDDYKIVGKENSEKMINTKMILNELNVDNNKQNYIIDIIKSMGYSNYLKGIRPKTLEGQIVSDADMCDAIGSSGIVRSIVYATSSKGNGIIFDRDIYPNVNITNEEYNQKGTTHSTDNAINHFFEKLLKLNNLMMTKSGKKESNKRQKIMIDFLRQYFYEENAKEWLEFLDEFLKSN